MQKSKNVNSYVSMNPPIQYVVSVVRALTRKLRVCAVLFLLNI